jgi:hypothetical protein
MAFFLFLFLAAVCSEVTQNTSRFAVVFALVERGMSFCIEMGWKYPLDVSMDASSVKNALLSAPIEICSFYFLCCFGLRAGCDTEQRVWWNTPLPHWEGLVPGK